MAGDFTVKKSAAPTEVPLHLSGIEGKDIEHIACAANSSLLLLKNGKLYGSGSLGHLGGKEENSNNFVQVPYFIDKNVTNVERTNACKFSV